MLAISLYLLYYVQACIFYGDLTEIRTGNLKLMRTMHYRTVLQSHILSFKIIYQMWLNYYQIQKKLHEKLHETALND